MPPCSQCNISFVSIEGAQLGLVPTQRKMLKIKPEVTARGKGHEPLHGVRSTSPFGNLIEIAPPKRSVQGNVIRPVLHGGPPRVFLFHEQSGRRSKAAIATRPLSLAAIGLSFSEP